MTASRFWYVTLRRELPSGLRSYHRAVFEWILGGEVEADVVQSAAEYWMRGWIVCVVRPLSENEYRTISKQRKTLA